MLTWKDYYGEYERRHTLINEARRYQLVKAFLHNKESRLRKSSFRIQVKKDANIMDLSFEHK